jgi:sulfonate transport system permease protein
MTVIDLPTKQPTVTTERRRLRLPRGVERLAGVVVVLAIWQLASSTGLLSTQVLAGPASVLQAGWDLTRTGVLPSAIWASLQRVLIGLAIGVPIGAALALVAGLSRAGDNLVDAPMQAARFVPIIGLQPLIVLWFGIGNVAKISLIVFGVMFPIYINTYSAVRDLDPRYVELARTVGLNRWQVIRRVVLPGALPGFMVGLRLAVAVAWLILVFAEQINATNGIGYLIIKAQTFFQTETIIVGLATYALLGLITNVLVRATERRTLAWLPSR